MPPHRAIRNHPILGSGIFLAISTAIAIGLLLNFFPRPTHEISDTGGIPSPATGQRLLYSSEFATGADVHAAASSATANAGIKPSDTTNGALQIPSVHGNCAPGPDLLAHDGRALIVATRAASYPLPNNRTGYGLANGRCNVFPSFTLAGKTVSMRVRTSVTTGKAADMVFPSQGWSWEADMRERFAGHPNVSIRFHADLGRGNGAIYQKIVTWPVDPRLYHVYSVTFGGSKQVTSVSFTLDGRTVFTVTDPAWMPRNNPTGSVAIGKACPGPRGQTPLSHIDSDFLDWAAVYAPVGTVSRPAGQAPDLLPAGAF